MTASQTIRLETELLILGTGAAGCGAALLATAHGWDRRDLEERPLSRELRAAGVFRRLVLIRREGARRRYEVGALP